MKNSSQEALQSTNSLGVKLILVGIMAIFLFSSVSAGSGVGGTITKSGDYYIHTFTSNATFNWTGNQNNFSFLMVGGGGAGGQDSVGAGGGGGAGGMIYNGSANITAGAYTVNIGLGGNSSGANSSFNFTTLQAGGGGIGSYYPGAGGSIGGSGGGASQNGAGGFAGTTGQGNAGGSGGAGAGGGGGAGSVGASNSGANAGNGGSGTANAINGTSVTWACGGGGAGNSGGTNGTGGCATAGTGRSGLAGTANFGGGGGGGGEGDSNGNGGSGILIIRYNNASALTPTLISPANNTNTSSQTNFFVVSIINDTSNNIGVTNVSLFINGTLNQTNTSQLNGTYNFTVPLPFGLWNWTVQSYGNDTSLNNATNGTFNLNVQRISYFNFTFDNQTIESTSTILKTNFTLASGLGVSSVNLTYNQTNYSASFTTTNSSGYYQATVTLTTPSVNANTNMTFNWTVFLTDATQERSINNLQTVLNFGIDDCTANTVMIYNFTMKNEATQVNLINSTDNTSIKISLLLYPNGSLTVPTFNFSRFYNQTLPARVCVSNGLGNALFFSNAQIQYDADGYASEFYNIQNYSLNATSNPSQNITLYDIADSQNQPFIITYRDSNFLPVSGALIQIGRLYVDEGVTKTVEIPMTDTAGETIGNLALNTVVYTFTVTKNGAVLAVFSNQLAKCQTPLISSCVIDLNSFSSSISVTNFSASTDFLYTLTYNKVTRIVSSSFTIPSGGVSTILLNVTSTDAISTSLCSQNVTTSSGTLTCTIPASFGNSTAYASLYKDGVLIAYGQVSSEQNPSDIYPGILVFLGVLVFLTLLGAGLTDSPVLTVIFLLVGVGLLFGLNLVAHNGFIGGLASILWLVIVIIIVIVKGGKRT